MERRELLVVSTFTVDALGDVDDGIFTTGQQTLREAIGRANITAGVDLIDFDPGVFSSPQTIALSAIEQELTISESVTLDASAVLGNVSIDAGAVSRLIHFSATTGDLTLNGLKLSNGSVSRFGGGIYFNSSGTLTLNNCSLSGSTSGGKGGGVYAKGNVSLTHSTVSGNTSSMHGAGIYTYSGNVTLTSSTVSGNNSHRYGGGIATYSGSLSLTNSTVSGNTANSLGGGVYTYSGSVSLTSSTVSGNSSGVRGGGIYAYSGSVSLTSSTVSGNSSTGVNTDGGGIYTRSASVSLTSSTVSGNDSGTRGGGIFTYSGNVSLTSSTISDNATGGAGGGVFVLDTNMFTIENSIVAGNTDSGIAPDLRPDSSSTLTVNNSLIGVADGLTITGNIGNLTGVAATPLDPMLGPLVHNGGPTKTHALKLGSPAIDAGNHALLPADVNDLDGDVNFAEPIPFDQRGIGFNRIVAGQVDMGAVEKAFDAPRVTRVEVASTNWTPQFLTAIGGSGQGYTIPQGTEQLDTLPWLGLNQIRITFSEDVGQVLPSDVSVRGVNALSYPHTVAYNSIDRVATITLRTPIGIDKVLVTVHDSVTDSVSNALDGEWVDGQTGDSGNSQPGGKFAFRFNALPGDSNQSGAAAVNDLGGIRISLGSSAANSANSVINLYSIFADTNGSGAIAVNDVQPLRTNLGRSLPIGEPQPETAIAAVATTRLNINQWRAAIDRIHDDSNHWHVGAFVA